MSVLFTPIRIGTLEVPNRLARSATGEGMCAPDGGVTPPLVELYRRLARGGAGLLMTGHSFVRPDGKASDGMMGVHSDEMIPGLRRIVQAVGETDARIACQLNHAGRQTRPERIGGVTPVGPSAVRCPVNRVTPRALEEAEIEPLIESFVAAAVRCREAGFDGVQLHCAHGYLMSEFISPHTNRRDDAWGGSLEARARFPLEVLRRIRCALGADYPVLVKLNAEDFIEGGLTLEESTRIGAMMEAEGIDAIEVSAGMARTASKIMRRGIETESDEAYFLPHCRELRRHVGVPLLCVGGLRSKGVMERIVESGDADIASLCRPLIREPDLPRKFRQGACDRAACVSCNRCTRGPDQQLGCALEA
ncbi:MAG: NADH:flavin oxidoreductase [Candidatus Brocadiia bacterium]